MKNKTFIFPIIRKDFIGKALETLHKYTEDFYVFVIDQTGDSETYDKYNKLSHLWIHPYRNLGFSKAMNTGIVLSQTPYIGLMNDDIEFMNKRWWQGIIDTFETDKNIVAVNPMSPKEGAWGYGLRADNKDTWQPDPKKWVTDETKESVYPVKPDGTPLLYKEEFTEEDYDFLLNNHPNWSPNTTCDAIAMWGTIWKKEGFEELGLLDERFYPGGGEDYDMDARAYSCAWPKERDECDPTYHRRMVGTSKSWVWHHWGSSGRQDYQDKLFESRKRWNANDELWGDKFDVWGHETIEDKKIPLKRVPEIFIDEL